MPVLTFLGYLICSPAASALVAGELAGNSGYPADQLFYFYRNVWYATLFLLVILVVFLWRPWPDGYWKVARTLRKRYLLMMAALVNVIVLQVLLWQTPSACEVLGLSEPAAERFETILVHLYGPPMALVQWLFSVRPQQRDVAGFIVEIALSVAIYTIIVTPVIVVVLLGFLNASQVGRRGDAQPPLTVA
jgi:hypothetical protein